MRSVPNRKTPKLNNQNADMTIEPSAMRRLLMLVFICLLGFLLILIGLNGDNAPFWTRLFFVGLGGLVLVLVPFFSRATAQSVTLTQTHMIDGQGREICRIDNVEAVERGAFAFKPSNGFLLRLHKRADRGWVPGIWWRFGRKIGIGGVLAASQTKAMAEIISMRIAANQTDK